MFCGDACYTEYKHLCGIVKMHTFKPCDCGDKPLNKLKVYRFFMFKSNSVIPFIQTYPGCQERELSIPMVPLPTNERRDQC